MGWVGWGHRVCQHSPRHSPAMPGPWPAASHPTAPPCMSVPGQVGGGCGPGLSSTPVSDPHSSRQTGWNSRPLPSCLGGAAQCKPPPQQPTLRHTGHRSQAQASSTPRLFLILSFTTAHLQPQTWFLRPNATFMGNSLCPTFCPHKLAAPQSEGAAHHSWGSRHPCEPPVAARGPLKVLLTRGGRGAWESRRWAGWGALDFQSP